MARWELKEDHYIRVFRARRGPTEWEYVETDRLTGEQERTRFPVPLYCPKETIICTKGSERADDNSSRGPDGLLRGMGPVVWEGDPQPTPAMEPLDAEAQEITDRWKDKWGGHPIDSLPSEGGFNQNLLAMLEAQLNSINSRLPAAVPVAQSGVSREEFEALQMQLKLLLEEKAEREAAEKIDLGEVSPPQLAPQPRTRRVG